ncbi:acid-sensing ion channel 2-like [Acropora muricata]|uniref:acid-sensing ion channel 2-like n=1 Tax=Acropora muricata TaxID=159855 RepID=UPI0034E434CB
MITFKLQDNKVRNITDTETVEGQRESLHSTKTGNAEPFAAFLENTTLHGARFLVTGSVFRRLFWTVALVSSFAYCALQIYNTLEAFSERPFSTKITTKTSNKAETVPFPAVTICNYNSFNRRRFKSYVQQNSTSNWSDEEVNRRLNLYEKFMIERNNDFFSPEMIKQYPEMTERVMEEHLHYLVLFSHVIEEMLLPKSSFGKACTINDLLCGPKNFKPLYNTQFGKCFTFNSGQDQSPIIKASLEGQTGGLKLQLNVERESYLLDPSNPYVGLTVLVHDQKSFPLMEHFGFAVHPGVRTLVAVKRKKFHNLPSPFSTKCIKDRSLQMLVNTSFSYSKPACIIGCISKFIVENCKCRPIEYKDRSVPLCGPMDTILCLFPKYNEFVVSKEKADCEESCTQPCEQTEYETTLSYAGLQRDVFIKWLNSSQDTTGMYENFPKMTYSEKKEYIDENIISLDVYFQDLNYDEIVQVPKFEIFSLIANLGGNFGLFLGISLLSILEILDFIFKRIWCLIRRT